MLLIEYKLRNVLKYLFTDKKFKLIARVSYSFKSLIEAKQSRRKKRSFDSS